MVRFLRKIFVVLPFILRLIFMFKPDYINFIQTIYNKNNNIFLINHNREYHHLFSLSKLKRYFHL